MTIDDDRPRALAAYYLAARRDSWWRWDARGQTIEWADGRTIAFAGEIRSVLARLASNGLPPFGSVVLLLAACREGYLDPPSRRGQLHGYIEAILCSSDNRAAAPLAGLLSRRLNEAFSEVADRLDAVAQFPEDLRQSTTAKSLLAEAVFEVGERELNPAAAAVVLERLAGPLDGEALTDAVSSDDALPLFAAELEALRAGLAAVNAEALWLRARTGTEQLPLPAELKLPDDPPPAERVRELLSRLQNDPELAGVARLAQKLMAAVHVPRALGAAEELPVGGVSDLSNRGSFDRLLVSELAQDDLTLAVRIAMNEALYLRRESPPRRPPPRRAILLDSGIRMWGVPRLFATSVGLALAATADARGELHVCGAAADRAAPVEFTTREGLIRHLESLEPEAHPGRALTDFAAIAAGVDGNVAKAAKGEVEMIVVTHADVLADADFFRQANAAARGEWFAATVDARGSFALHACGPAGRKLVCSADLSLEEILAPPRSASPVPLVVKDRDPHLPAILFVEPFPLRLPHVLDSRNSRFSNRHGLFTVTNDGRMLQWDSPAKAARQLSVSLPGGRFHDAFIDPEQRMAHAVFHRHRQNQLVVVSVNLETRKETRLEFGANLPLKVAFRHGVLYLIGRRDVEAISLGTGYRLRPLALPGDMRWMMSRFFRTGKTRESFRCLALAQEGANIVLCPVPNIEFEDRAVFDHLDGGGPCALTPEGHLKFSPDDAERRILPRPPFERVIAFSGVSPDGRRLVVEGGDGKDRNSYGIDLRDTPAKWVPIDSWHGRPAHAPAASNPGEMPAPQVDWHEWILGDAIRWSHTSGPAPLPSFDGIFSDGHTLLLYTSGGRSIFGFTLGSEGSILLAQVREGADMHHPLHFKPIQPPESCRFSLKMVEWTGGSRAYLDGRGMLHLRSAHKAIPEMSIVLANGRVAVWALRGESITVSGPEQFLEQGSNTIDAFFTAALGRFANEVF